MRNLETAVVKPSKYGKVRVSPVKTSSKGEGNGGDSGSNSLNVSRDLTKERSLSADAAATTR